MGTKLKVIQALLFGALVTIASLPAQSQEEAAAEGEQGSRFADMEATRVRAISQSLNRDLEPVREALSPSAEEEGGPVPEPNPQAALNEIQNIRIDRLPPFEQAEVHYLFGYIYYELDNLQQVKRYWRLVVDEEEANLTRRVDTMKALAIAHYSDEEYEQALELYLDWMSYQEIIGATDYALIGNIYYTLEDYDNALENLEHAIGMREEIGEVGEENWYSLQKSIYYTRGDFNAVIDVLQKVIVYYPNVRYWRELGSMYYELEQERAYMIAYDLAWKQDGITRESDILGLAYMYVSAGAPLQAAEVIVEGFEKGLIEENEKNLLSIGQFYYMARALDEALEWTERAANIAETGDTYAWLANIYLDMGRNEDAYRAATEALDKGGLDDQDQVRLQAGSALYNLYRYDDALRQFRAVSGERHRQNAQTWIRFVENEAAKDRAFRADGIELDAIREDIYGQL